MQELRKMEQWEALAAGLAHEIKNPLSTIILTLQLVREDLQTPGSQKPAGLLPRIDMVISEVQHLQKIVNDFMRLARNPKLCLQAGDVNTLIEEVQAFLAPEFQERGIDLVMQLDRTIGKTHLDQPFFRQVVNNLVRNALQATPEGGVITIQTRRLGDRFVLEVIDTGKGIPAALQERVFDGFFSTRSEGTGIGLSLVRQIVQLHGGEVTCQSEEGRGSLFRVTIPIGGFVAKEPLH